MVFLIERWPNVTSRFFPTSKTTLKQPCGNNLPSSRRFSGCQKNRLGQVYFLGDSYLHQLYFLRNFFDFCSNFPCQISDLFFLHIKVDCKFLKSMLLLQISTAGFAFKSHLDLCGQLNLARLPQLNPKSVAIFDHLSIFQCASRGSLQLQTSSVSNGDKV